MKYQNIKLHNLGPEGRSTYICHSSQDLADKGFQPLLGILSQEEKDTYFQTGECPWYCRGEKDLGRVWVHQKVGFNKNLICWFYTQGKDGDVFINAKGEIQWFLMNQAVAEAIQNHREKCLSQGKEPIYG